MTRQQRLFEIIKALHGNQVRKYTGLPYWTHLVTVATKAELYHPLGFEIGICHDVVEDVKGITLDILKVLINSIGQYSEKEVSIICEGVRALTDVYTKDSCPLLNRKERKNLEANRLGLIAPEFQTIKYIDILDNLTSIKIYDASFYQTFVEEKTLILIKMNQGDQELFQTCKNFCK